MDEDGLAVGLGLLEGLRVVGLPRQRRDRQCQEDGNSNGYSLDRAALHGFLARFRNV